jgi:hypothetical protein
VLLPRVLAVALLAMLGAGTAAGTGTSPSAQTGTSPPAQTGTSPASEALVSGSVAVGAPSTPATLDVRAENSRPATKGWRIGTVRGTAPGLQAFAAATSVLPGRPVPLMVSGQGVVTVRAFRIGWYGGGQARQVWRGTLSAHSQSGDAASWPASGRLDTSTWPEGHYVLRLDLGSASRYVPLTVRSKDARGRILVLTSPMTWAAENAGPTAPTVSFDRPYRRSFGSGGFMVDDAGLVQQAERTGLRLAYATDLDVATNPSLVTGAAAVIVGSDSRYWTSSGRTALSVAANAGTNLAFFGAGTGSRTVTLDGADRTLAISRSAPSPSVRLTGLRPSCARTASARPPDPVGWKVADAGWWGYRGTGVTTGDVLPGLVGDGADHASTTAVGRPPSIQVLSFETLTCGSQLSAQTGVYVVRRSGAGVFTAGTGRWVCAISGACLKPASSADSSVRAFVSTVTSTVIRAFATPGAGTRNPARDTVDDYPALG